MKLKLFDELNADNFELYAIRNYYNPTCVDAEEFYEDLKRFKYIKRLLTRYCDSGSSITNLLLNHIVVVFNAFGYEAELRMLEYKVITEDNISVIKPFLIYLKAIDNTKYTNTTMDRTIVDELRKI